MLRCCCIGQLFTIRLLLSGILGVVGKRLLLAILPRDWSYTRRNMLLKPRVTGTLLSCRPRMTVTSCFVYKVIMDLSSIDHLCINPILPIGLALAQVDCTSSILLNNCKQNNTSLSFLVCTTVVSATYFNENIYWSLNTGCFNICIHIFRMKT